ncbi:hypothetical protein [Gorillibacterium sp. sgz5001074]|uniref:hypothetical protein n=1 Tax=Gorillibacterium sp. sgz5001074 TaxID=3446695 RepID=UPI003F665678
MNFRFDGNEWFVVVCSIVLLTCVWIIRKHFPPMLMVLLWIYNLAFVATIDYALAATPFHIYDCLDNETYEPMATYAHLFMYTPYSFIFLYFYDKWSISRRKLSLLLYLTLLTGVAILFEWICLKFRFLDYSSGWKLYWSIPTYPMAALLLIRTYRFLTNHLVHHPFRTPE